MLFLIEDEKEFNKDQQTKNENQDKKILDRLNAGNVEQDQLDKNTVSPLDANLISPKSAENNSESVIDNKKSDTNNLPNEVKQTQDKQKEGEQILAVEKKKSAQKAKSDARLDALVKERDEIIEPLLEAIEKAKKIDENSDFVFKKMKLKIVDKNVFSDTVKALENLQSVIFNFEKDNKKWDLLIEKRKLTMASAMLQTLKADARNVLREEQNVQNIFEINKFKLTFPAKKSKENGGKKSNPVHDISAEAFANLEQLKQIAIDAQKEEKLITKHAKFKRSRDNRAMLLISLRKNRDIISHSVNEGNTLYKKILDSLATNKIPVAKENTKKLREIVEKSKTAWHEIFNSLAVLDKVATTPQVTKEIIAQAEETIKQEKTVEISLKERDINLRIEVASAQLKALMSQHLQNIQAIKNEALEVSQNSTSETKAEDKREINLAISNLEYSFEKAQEKLSHAKSDPTPSNVASLEVGIDKDLDETIEHFVETVGKFLPEVLAPKQTGKILSQAQIQGVLKSLGAKANAGDKKVKRQEAKIELLVAKKDLVSSYIRPFLTEKDFNDICADIEAEWKMLNKELGIIKNQLERANMSIENHNVNGAKMHLDKFSALMFMWPQSFHYFDHYISSFLSSDLRETDENAFSAFDNEKYIKLGTNSLRDLESFFQKTGAKHIAANSLHDLVLLKSPNALDLETLRVRDDSIKFISSLIEKSLKNFEKIIVRTKESIKNIDGIDVLRALNALAIYKSVLVNEQKFKELNKRIKTLSIRQEKRVSKSVLYLAGATLIIIVAAAVVVSGLVVGFIKIN